MAFGHADRIKETTRDTRETHAEAGSAGAGAEASNNAKGPKLSVRMKAHYDKMIADNYYSGYNDPKLKAELKYVKQ